MSFIVLRRCLLPYLQIPAPTAYHWRTIKADLRQQQKQQLSEEAQATAATIMVLLPCSRSVCIAHHRLLALGVLQEMDTRGSLDIDETPPLPPPSTSEAVDGYFTEVRGR